MDGFKYSRKDCDRVYEFYSYMVDLKDQRTNETPDMDRLEELTCAAGKVVIKTLNKINKKLRRD